MVTNFIFVLVVMVSAILASPSDRVRGREKERKRKIREKLLLSYTLEIPRLEFVLGLFANNRRLGV
jgi:hypothetical protein